MAGPWEQYAPQESAAPSPVSAGPWEQYAEKKSGRSAVDKLFGLTGERYQTWPEKVVRDMASLPERTITAAASAPAGSREATEAMIPTATETAATMIPVNPAIRAGDKIIPGASKAIKTDKVTVPTTQELQKAGSEGIEAARNSGLDIAPSAVSDYVAKLEQKLFDSGIHPVDAPATFKKLDDLKNAPSDSIFTAGNLQSLRESFGATAQNFNPAAAKDQLAATRIIKGLDEFLPNIDEASVLAGTPSATHKLAETGRKNYAAAQRSNDITGVLDRANTGILERAETRAKTANSGLNIDNTIRSKVASALEKPKEISGLSDDELAALNQVIEGGAGRNSARRIANLLGGGGGVAQTMFTGAGAAAGATMGGLPGAAIGAAIPATVGGGAKAIANALAKRDLRKVDELLRKRSPLYEDRLKNADRSVISPEKRAAIARAMMAQQFE